MGVVEKSVEQAWKITLEALRESIGEPDYGTLIEPLRAVAATDRSLLLEAPSRQVARLVSDRYLTQMEESLSREVGTPVSLLIREPDGSQQELFPFTLPNPVALDALRRARHASLLPDLTFSEFVVGASNQFAHAACQATAGWPGEKYNPLFLYGGSGLGKTHLLNAVGHAVLERFPDRKVLYLSSESFMNELIHGLRRNRMDEFRARFRHIDVLIVDDVQFLAGRERTQEEFFHTFNTLYETRRQILVAADCFPKDIPELEERLRNRFEWGLIADLQPPDLETRLAILARKADQERLFLPPDAAHLLATRIPSNIRELEGTLKRLAALASLRGREISVALVEEVLPLLQPAASRQITIEEIQAVVGRFYALTRADLVSRGRARHLALPRQIAMYLCRQYTNASFPTIGERFGGRDHTTALHAARVIESRLAEDPALREHLRRLQGILEGGPETQERPPVDEVGEKR